jgi:histone-lysine N-methyltransferase SETD3
MTSWLDSGGADYSKLSMRYYREGYRGVHSTTFIAKSETLLYVPKSHVITLEMAKDAPIGSKMDDARLRLLSPKHGYLSTFLL